VQCDVSILYAYLEGNTNAILAILNVEVEAFGRIGVDDAGT